MTTGHGTVPPAEALGGGALGAGVLLGGRPARRRGLTGAGEDGAPGGIRTPDQWLRKPLLYPAELRARGTDTTGFPVVAGDSIELRGKNLPWRPGRACQGRGRRRPNVLKSIVSEQIPGVDLV